jgi:hypothetical protein
MVSVFAKYGQLDKRIVGIELRKSSEKIKPDHEINDIKELLEILK